MDRELKRKAYEAFKQKYGELPADAGYPVIRQRYDSMYFARNVDDWHDFVKGQKHLRNIIVFVLLIAFAIIITVVIGTIFSNINVPLVALGSYCAVLFLFSVFYTLKHKNEPQREIIVYDDYDETISIVTL